MQFKIGYDASTIYDIVLKVPLNPPTNLSDAVF